MLRRGGEERRKEEGRGEERRGEVWVDSFSPSPTTPFTFGLQVATKQNYKFRISWLEVTQGPKAVKLTDSQLGSTGEIGHRAKNTYLCLSLSLSLSLSCLLKKRQSKTERKSK